jgi:hypothetical protein
MAGKFGLGRRFPEIAPDNVAVQINPIRNRNDCLIQLRSAFQDIADFDDIHQAAERLDAVQAWISREALAAAADPIFDDGRNPKFDVTQMPTGSGPSVASSDAALFVLISRHSA